MAWFDRNPGEKREPEKADNEEPPAPDSHPAGAGPSPKSEPVGLTGKLYPDSRVRGHLEFRGAARIDGSVDGEIQCHGTLTIGEGAEVRAKISGQAVIIRGKVEGDVVAKEKIELLAPARLSGHIDAPRLIVMEGAVFDGDCSMGMAKQKGGVAGSQILGAEKAAAAKTPRLQADFDK
jgi:cytoskeletal protein CcmA (bactofilin family)